MGKPVSRVSEWSPEREVQAGIYDLLSSILTVLVAANSKGKPPRVPPFPRPVTASQRLANRLQHRAHVSLVRRLLPDED